MMNKIIPLLVPIKKTDHDESIKMNEQKDKIKMPIIMQCQNAMHDLPFH